jgi:hypothetical protein
MRTMLIGLAAVALSSFAFADEVVLTSSNSKSGSATAIDFVSDGATAGVQVNLQLPLEATKSGVDLSRLKIATGDFQLVSAVNGTEVIVLVTSPSNSVLPKGVISFGSLTLKGGNVTLKSVVAGNAKAEAVNTTSRAQ